MKEREKVFRLVVQQKWEFLYLYLLLVRIDSTTKQSNIECLPHTHLSDVLWHRLDSDRENGGKKDAELN